MLTSTHALYPVPLSVVCLSLSLTRTHTAISETKKTEKNSACIRNNLTFKCRLVPAQDLQFYKISDENLLSCFLLV